MKYFTIKNQRVLVDDMNKKWLSNYSWCIGVNGYAVARVKGKVVYMHRLLFHVKSGQLVDHMNGNKLDNRFRNLRLCTSAQNARNQKIRFNNTSGFKGVSWDKVHRKYHAYIKVDYRRKHLGYFDNIIDAKNAYIQGAIKYHGKFARVV